MNPHARCGYHDKKNPFLKFSDSLVLGNRLIFGMNPDLNFSQRNLMLIRSS